MIKPIQIISIVFIGFLTSCSSNYLQIDNNFISIGNEYRVLKDSLDTTPFPKLVVQKKFANEYSNDSKKIPADTILVDIEPTIINSTAPFYPTYARRNNIQGTVFLKIWITELGDVRRAQLIYTSDTIFIEPSMKAVMNWRYSPAIKNGKPIDVSFVVPINYKLNSR